MHFSERDTHRQTDSLSLHKLLHILNGLHFVWAHHCHKTWCQHYLLRAPSFKCNISEQIVIQKKKKNRDFIFDDAIWLYSYSNFWRCKCNLKRFPVPGYTGASRILYSISVKGRLWPIYSTVLLMSYFCKRSIYCPVLYHVLILSSKPCGPDLLHCAVSCPNPV